MSAVTTQPMTEQEQPQGSDNNGSGGLVLDSLEVKNFRAFRHLTIEKLGRVNLITGRNNVGKSSLLEALWIYVNQGDPAIIRQILRARREVNPLPQANRPALNSFTRALFSQPSSSESVRESNRLDGVSSLYHGRPSFDQLSDAFSINDINNAPNQLSGTILYYGSPEPGAESEVLTPKQLYHRQSQPGLFSAFYAVIRGNQPPSVFPLDQLFKSPDATTIEQPSLQLVKLSGLTDAQLGLLWDNVASTDLEDDITRALQLLYPGISRISFIGSSGTVSGRTAIGRLPGSSNPVPLRSLGDGIARLFGMILSLANYRDSMLLLDEIESGIHYSVLPDVWKLIFDTARRLNVQVFATTHSWDCIEAFQEAAAESPEEGVLVRLQNKDGDVTSTVFDERRLAVVTRQGIEVR